MPLTPGLAPASFRVTDITFTMRDGTKNVTCHVLHSAVKVLERVDQISDDELQTAFRRHIERLQAIASAKYDSGAEAPVIGPFDVKGR